MNRFTVETPGANRRLGWPPQDCGGGEAGLADTCWPCKKGSVSRFLRRHGTQPLECHPFLCGSGSSIHPRLAQQRTGGRGGGVRPRPDATRGCDRRHRARWLRTRRTVHFRHSNGRPLWRQDWWCSVIVLRAQAALALVNFEVCKSMQISSITSHKTIGSSLICEHGKV